MADEAAVKAAVDLIPPVWRTRIYAAASGLIPVLTALEFALPESVRSWIALASAVVGVGAAGTAVAHRPTR